MALSFIFVSLVVRCEAVAPTLLSVIARSAMMPQHQVRADQVVEAAFLPVADMEELAEQRASEKS